jgi:hypothetical protein
MRSMCLAGVIFASMLACGGSAVACNPAPPEPAYSYRTHPDFPLQSFTAGRLGVILPTWSPTFLVVAYRQLAGIGVDAEEQRALLSMWERIRGPLAVGAALPSERSSGALGEWLDERTKLGAAGPNGLVDRYSGYYFSYENCLSDAFRTAAATLRKRAARHGPHSEVVKQWVAAQDQVFSNCGGSAAIPQPLSRPSDPLAAADREYQIASAHFYAGHFDEALADFLKIAADANSVWRGMARHLVARCLIRKATLQESGFDQGVLESAERQLRSILADETLSEVHPASERLLRFVRARLDVPNYCGEVRAELVKRHAGAGLAIGVLDYARGCWVDPTDDLTVWMHTVSSAREKTAAERQRAVASALDRWRERRQLHWLVAALVTAMPDDPRALEALRTASAVDVRGVAAATINYHAARLDLALGNSARARQRLDRLVALGEATLGRSAHNLALSMRMEAASDLADLLRHAARRPAAWIEPEVGDDPVTDAPDDNLRLDDRASDILSWLPLNLQIEAVMSDALPVPLRVQLAGAAWVKAVVAEEDGRARRVAERLVALRPESTQILGAYLHAADATTRSREALMVLSRRVYPPLVLPRGSLVGGVAPPPHKRLAWFNEGYDAGWYAWRCGVGQSFCKCSPPDSCSGCESPSAWDRVQRSLPGFLSEQQRAEVRQEWERLAAVGSGPEFLCARTIEWANAAPHDPRVPEALHRAVASTFWGCEGDRLGSLSHRAYRLLHARYSDTPWAKQTKYWYRGR